MSIEQLKSKIKNKLTKRKLLFERIKRVEVEEPEKYNAFGHGMIYGEIKTLTSILSMLTDLNKQ